MSTDYSWILSYNHYSPLRNTVALTHGYASHLIFTHLADGKWKREFVLLLIPLLTRKLKRTMPSLLSHPSLLAHTIYQALSFDAALIEEGFTVLGTSAVRGKMGDSKGAGGDVEKWPGVSEVILGKKEWFDAWLTGEKKCESGVFGITIVV